MERWPTYGRSRFLRPPPFAWLVLGAALLAGTGCRKAQDDAAPAGPVSPPPMSVAEQERGLQACRAYAERVCRCARTDPSLAEACSLAPSRPSSLEGALAVVNDGYDRIAVNDQIASQTNARNIIDRCFEADAKLNPATCPRDPPTDGELPSGPAGAAPPSPNDPDVEASPNHDPDSAPANDE